MYQTIDTRPTRCGGTGRRVVFVWTPPPVVPERVYTSPLLEARRYAAILQRDPFIKTQADLARKRRQETEAFLLVATEIRRRSWRC